MNMNINPFHHYILFLNKTKYNKQTNKLKQTNKQTNKQTDRQNKQTNRQTDRQTDRQTNVIRTSQTNLQPTSTEFNNFYKKK